ncbi:hypothetical protein NKDENANG_01406 [Candidatus Entotheonellaceae bacterium PAL068K]
MLHHSQAEKQMAPDCRVMQLSFLPPLPLGEAGVRVLAVALQPFPPKGGERTFEALTSRYLTCIKRDHLSGERGN